ncbi:YcfL family protein [Martelella alba]|uniref:DUF1425 domain-containing protein n=1 Tax=Martelella alba TaxID=2590451 RepID=A0ABY2SQN2_9HYPH|nr:DUF1425 domain-containing protein [Martelella alba]TKI07710.1 DUF1425 domain-containing protein [Martelella alba]
MRNCLRRSICLAGVLAFCLPLLAGCGGHPILNIDNRQSLVMDSSVATAGITADRPAIGDVQGRKRAYAAIRNGQSHPVTIHYRFYWYDRQGLDILPFPPVQTLSIPAGGTVTVESFTGNLKARRVRLYLYL